MRVDPELTYQDYRDRVEDAFRLLENNICKSVDDVTNYMTDEDNDLLVKDSTSLAIWIITIGEYEIRHNILEERVHDQLCYHIPRFLDGIFDDDLTKEEHKQMQKDVDYILSKVEMYKIQTMTKNSRYLKFENSLFRKVNTSKRY